jgi:hypothetical protein
MGEGATSVSFLSRLAATTAAVIILCVSSGAQASGDRYYDFENGIPEEITIIGPGWEVLSTDTRADGLYIGNRPLQNGEETSFSVTTELDQPAVLSFKYSSTSSSQGLRVITNHDQFSLSASVSRWDVFSIILEAGEQTISWQTDAQTVMLNNPTRVLIDSIRISQPNNRETQLSVVNKEHAFYRKSYFPLPLDNPSIESLGNLPVFRQSILPGYENTDDGRGTYLSWLTTPAPQGGLETIGRPFVAGQDTTPRFFNFGGEDFVAVKRNSGWNGAIIDLLEFDTFSRISTFPIRVLSEYFTFADVSGDGELDIIVAESTNITAYDFNTGEIHWQKELGNFYPRSIEVEDLSPSPGSEVLVASRPGFMLSGATGEVLWSYPLGFREKMETGDFDGDGKNEFLSLDADGNLVIFDPRLRSPVATFSIPNVTDAQIVDFGNDGKDELLIYSDTDVFEVHELEAGELITQIQFDQELTGFYDAETNINGDILIAISVATSPQFFVRYGFANLSTREIYGLSQTAFVRHTSYPDDAVGVLDGPVVGASEGFILLAGPSTDRGTLRLTALDRETLNVNHPESIAIDAILPDSIEVIAIGVGPTHLNDEQLVVLGREGDVQRFYVIDLESDTLVTTFNAFRVSQRSWYVKPIGNGDVLIHDRRQIHIFNLPSESITWSSIAFDEKIKRAIVYIQDNRKKVFINTEHYIASLDLETRVFEQMVQLPFPSKVVGVSIEDREILLGSGTQIDIYSLDSFQAVESFPTASNPTTAWSLAMADKRFLFITMAMDWLQVIDRNTGDTVTLQQTGIPQLAARRQPLILEASQSAATFIVQAPVSLHRFEVKLTSEIIFSDQFLGTSEPEG